MVYGFYAHKPHYVNEAALSKDTWECLRDHIESVQRDSQKIIRKLQLSWLNEERERTNSFGLLHDIGKLKDTFQQKLETGNEPEKHAAAHAPIGARLVHEIHSDDILEYLIYGHHSGLTDGRDGLLEGIGRSQKSQYDDVNQLIGRAFEYDPFRKWYQAASTYPSYNSKLDKEFVIRFLFALCTAADHISTRRYMRRSFWQLAELKSNFSNERSVTTRLSTGRFNLLKRRLRSLYRQSVKEAKTKVAREVIECRKEWLSQSLKAARTIKSNFFTLDLPTGGGKTLTGLAFCYRYALKHGLKRVIYVAPYLNIIDQTANVFCRNLRIYRKNNYRYILEHHSNDNIDNKIDAYLKGIEEGKLATREKKDYAFLRMIEEQWRQPLIVTTMVQFVESLFSNKASRCQKLLNIANSVVFLDEFQMLPVEMRKDATVMLDQLARFCNCTFVFGSATNPPWQQTYGELPVKPIISNNGTPDAFKRVVAKWEKLWSFDKLIEELLASDRAFCVVNTRAAAQQLALVCAQYHPFVRCLTTLQNKRHRLEVLRECRRRLQDKNKPPVLLISTQSIEAGVDIDFPLGFRQLAPMDSIAQAAGRVNRNGKMKSKGRLRIFDLPSDEYQNHDQFYEDGCGVVRQLIGNKSYINIYDEALLSTYFDRLDKMYKTSKGVKYKSQGKSIRYCRENLLFQTVSDNMKLIDDRSISVLGPRNQNERKGMESNLQKMHDNQLSYSERQRAKRALHSYYVSLYENDISKLGQNIEEFGDELLSLLLCRHNVYHPLIGIQIPKIAK